jgi:hypothetical protein
MSVLKCWTGAAIAVLALAGGVRAEMTVSQSNDPTAALGVDIVTLLGQEKNAFGLVSPSRLQALVTPPPELEGEARNGGIAYDAAWLASQPAATGGADFQCLATALYFEARGEGVVGQAAVGEVILNRVASPSFPSTICGVVNQGNGRGCQFSYTCDGRADRVREQGAWGAAAKIARALMDGAPRTLTDGATYFHTPAVRPAWARRFERTASIGRHIFYRAPIQSAMN